MSSSRSRRVRGTIIALGAAGLLALAGCGSAPTSSDAGTTAVMPQPQGEVAMDSGAAVAEAPARVAAAVPGEKQVIRSASAVLGVEDLDASRASVLSIVKSAGGTVTSEVVYDGKGEPPQPYPMDMMATYPYYGYRQFVDVTFTVPQPQFEATMAKVRGLGNVVSVQQSATDVTSQVIDVDARVRAAQQSVRRVEALLADAKNLQELLLIEQELTTRQANLDSLLSQQKSLADQVADSTISVRLVPQQLIDEQGDPYAQPLWERVSEAFGNAWSGFVVGLAVISPLVTVLLLGTLIGLLVFWRVRRRHQGRESRPLT